jgi:hypothetical protein
VRKTPEVRIRDSKEKKENAHRGDVGREQGFWFGVLRNSSF